MSGAPVLGASLLAFTLYLNTLDADFAYDDSRAIQKNPDVLGDVPLLGLLSNDFWGTPLSNSGSHKSYRPVCVLTFRLNHAVSGLRPFTFHLTNVVLHVIVTALFCREASRLLTSEFAVWASGLVFASHPIHVEAVAGLVGRADILASAFALLALRAYHNYVRCGLAHNNGERSTRWSSAVEVAALTTLAMLSKEQGVTILAVCAVYQLFVYSKLSVWRLTTLCNDKSAREGSSLLVGLAVLLVFARILLMGVSPPEFSPADNPASDSDSLLTRALTFHLLPAFNVWLLACPSRLSFDWSMDSIPLVESIADPRNACTVVLWVSLVAAFVYVLLHLNTGRVVAPSSPAEASIFHVHSTMDSSSYSPTSSTAPQSALLSNGNGVHHHHHHRTERKRESPALPSINESCVNSRILVVSLTFMIAPFLPASNLLFYVGFVLAERVLYLPSMGFCLLFAHALHILSRRSRLASRMLLLFVVAAYSARTMARNRDWFSEETLYRSGIAINPAKAYGNLGNILNGQGRAAEAEMAYRAALDRRSNMADVHYNLGILLQEQKRYDEAIHSYELAIKCRPRLTIAHLNLAIVLALTGRANEAEIVYRRCADLDISGLKDPRLHQGSRISALYNLGRLLADQGRYADAVNVYEEAVQRAPAHYAPQSLYNMLGEAYSKLNSLTVAEQWYRKALAAKPNHVPAHLTMARLEQRRGNAVAAEAWYRKALALDANDVSLTQHYAQFLSEQARHEEAAKRYRHAAEHHPNDFELTFNTANALRQIGSNAEAERFYRRAVLLRPGEASAHMNLGAILHFNNKLLEAEQSYLTALNLKPEDNITRTNLKKLRNLIHKAKR